MKKHTPRLARRPWLDGLRGFAALLVLFYHAKTPLFAHGFIGVDVFFALFGFLLCSILILELKESSGIVLGNYYYRRAKRLLPLSLLVLILAAVAEKLFMNPMDSMQHRSLYFSAALYHANWRLLFDAADYFTPSDAVAPVQHYWSLSVEEVPHLSPPLFPLHCCLFSFCVANGLCLSVGPMGAICLARLQSSIAPPPLRLLLLLPLRHHLHSLPIFL